VSDALLDHVRLTVAHLGRSTVFYEAALAPLGACTVAEVPGARAWGRGLRPELWLMEREPMSRTHESWLVITKQHVCLRARSRAEVDAFRDAALAAGGTDGGAPSPHTRGHTHPYGARVLDPDGHDVEVVFHDQT